MLKSIFTAGLVFISLITLGQNGTIRGFVTDAESGEPIIFTNVYLEGTTIGASTDINGYYSLTKLASGIYTLKVSGISYEEYSEEVKVTNNAIITKNVALKSSAIEMDEFTVSAERKEARTRVKMSVTSVSTREISSLPSVGGQADIAQYMQVIPGVVFTGDQGGQLFIRGGSPVQNRVTLDGMTVMQPFHSIGLFSVFDTDLMKNADVYTGGFDAQYGERISSVIDITMRDGNQSKTHGVVGLNTFGAKASIEGPIKKPKNAEDGSITYVLSIKDSYLDETSKTIYPYVNDGDGLPFDFTDLFGKVTFGSSSGSKFNLQGFSFNDRVTFDQQTELNWVNWGIGGNFVLVPSSTSSLLQGRFNYSKYSIDLTEANNEPRNSEVSNFDLGMDMKYFMGGNTLKYGFDITGMTTIFNSFNSFGLSTKQESNTTNLSVYSLYQFLVANQKLVFNTGVRAIYYSSINFISLEPRLGAKFNISPSFRLKASWGIYTQNLVATNSDRDVVNLFYGFVTSPESINKEITNQDGSTTEVDRSIQKAIHYIGGFEIDITKTLNVNVEAYYKDYPQLINANRRKIYDETNTEVEDYLRRDFIVETGNVVGVDFVMNYDDRKNFIWLVYSYAKSERWDGQELYNPVFDRRHNINLVISRKFGKNNTWEANARWNFGSGFPFTQTAGFYELQNLADGISTDVTTSNSDDISFTLSGLNNGRLPTYHRLDLGVKKIFKFSRDSRLEVDLSVTNVYNRENVFYVNRFTSEVIYQLPILPAIGVNYHF